MQGVEYIDGGILGNQKNRPLAHIPKLFYKKTDFDQLHSCQTNVKIPASRDLHPS